METRQTLGPEFTLVRKQSNPVEPRFTEASRTPAKYEHLVIKDSFRCPSGESPYMSFNFNSFNKDTSLMWTTDAFSCLINIRFSDHRKSNSLMRKLYYQLCGAVAKCLRVLGINFLLPSPHHLISFVADIKHLLSRPPMRKNCFHKNITATIFFEN